MKILISGSSGLVGSALIPHFTDHGHQVTRLLRNKQHLGKDDIYWDPARDILDSEAFTGIDIVIHLAGKNIASGRWTRRLRNEIRASRINSARLLYTKLAGLKHLPKLLIAASATGYYGDRGDDIVNERAPAGTGFLAETCVDWESEMQVLEDLPIRTVLLRLGVVLSPRGGALAMMMPAFKAGLGGPLASGNQYMSWISIDDVVGVCDWVILHDDLAGSVNAVSPNPVTNKEFTKTLGAVIKRPVIVPAPAFLLKLALGDMANELLLSSTRAVPAKLLDSGYKFRHPDVNSALNELVR